jgi:hypothetical protein
MYETTKDKAYLIKAVNKSIDLINKRGTISAIVGLMTNNRNSIKVMLVKTSTWAENGIAISDMPQRLMEKEKN